MLLTFHHNFPQADSFFKENDNHSTVCLSNNCRVSTGENWQEVMLDCLGGQPCHGTVLNNTSNCGSDFAYVFFPSFYFVSSILVNLIDAIFALKGGGGC